MKYKDGRHLTISGTGCILADHFYTKIDFNGNVFQKYKSRETGDGGMLPGKLVFTEDLERFAHKQFEQIASELTNNRQSEKSNVGGPCIVALINAVQLLSKYDCAVEFYGALGNDETAEFIKTSLGNTGVDILNIKSFDTQSPFTSVFSDPDYDGGAGERIFVNNMGAALLYSPEDLKESFFDSDILVFGATALVPQIHDNLSRLLLKGKSRNCINIVTTVYDFRSEKKSPGSPWPLAGNSESYSSIDLLVTNRDEALAISGTDSTGSAIDHFIKLGVGAVVVTHGPNPVQLYSGGKLFQQRSLTKIPLLQKILENVKKDSAGDSTGCGDNFAGGVIASTAMQLIENEASAPDLIDACLWGMASGAFANFYLGGMYVEQFPGEKYEKISGLKEHYTKYVESLKI